MDLSGLQPVIINQSIIFLLLLLVVMSIMFLLLPPITILYIRKIIWQRQQVQMQVLLPITISIAIITINSTLEYIRILRLFIKSIHGILLKGNYLWVMDTMWR